jgi:SAM-dependent methyltransferase
LGRQDLTNLLLPLGEVEVLLRNKNVSKELEVQLDDVRDFWQAHPVAAEANPHELGSPQYFTYYDRLREANEPTDFSERLHEYTRFGGQRVLDVGSGNGYVLSRYSQAGARTFGVDLTQTAVDLCRRRFQLQRVKGQFLVANAEDLPFSTASFDCVCSMGVLHHTPDTTRAVAEIRRVLKPGGRLILMLYHRNSVLFRVKFPIVRILTGRTIAQLVNEVDGTGNPKGAVYSKRELLELLDGFTDLETFAGILPWTKLRGLERLAPSRLREWLDRRVGWFLYAKARRA